ncbi:MAG: hypothetical protein AAF633_10195 [Chloroflexota bacterium]
MSEDPQPQVEAPVDGGEARVTYRSCVGAVVVMLILAVCPILACRFMNSGQLEFGELPNNYVNIFLLQEPGKEGIGVQWSRTVDDEFQCIQTNARYFMFAGEGENIDYCGCSIEDENLPDRCFGPE